MTIGVTDPSPVVSLIRDDRTKFFPVRLPFQHHQLKNYISARHQDYLYFACRYEIYAIHLPTRRKRLVQSLHWKPSCLDAAHGWICAGGMTKGLCAFIHASNDVSASSDSLHPQSIHLTENLVPLDLDPNSDALNSATTSARGAQSSCPLKYELHQRELGNEIVNSIVVQLLPAGHGDAGDDVVAVLTNNDKSVVIYSLTKMMSLASTGEYPIAMNHATLSPDGNLLVAVGDEPRVFFSRRRLLRNKKKPQCAWTSEWYRLCEIKISLADPDDCCFTTAFSPSGHICAVASQAGVITIYDTAFLREDMHDDDAVIGIMRSSRQNIGNYRGAIRSMRFSPSPWDLLALGEDRGIVSVVDLRHALQGQQRLELRPEAAHVRQQELSDQEPLLQQRRAGREGQFLESYAETSGSRVSRATITSAADQVERATQQRRRLQNLAAHSQGLLGISSDAHSLSQSERQTVETLSSRRARGSEINPPQAVSINYSSVPNRYLPTGYAAWGRSTTSPSSLRASDAMRSASGHGTLSAPDDSTQILHPRRRDAILLSTPSLAPEHTSEDLMAANRRASTITTSPVPLPTASHEHPDQAASEELWQNAVTGIISSNGLDVVPRDDLRNSEDISRALETLESHQQWLARHTDILSQSSQAVSRADESWHRIRASIGASSEDLRQASTSLSAIDVPRSSQARNLQQLAFYTESRSRLGVLSSQLDASSTDRESDPNYDSDSGRITLGTRNGSDSLDGITTMGIDWSPDGRMLFVATEEGIFQYTVDTSSRHRFPAHAWL